MLLIAYSAKLSGDKLSKISEYDIELKKGAGFVLIIVGLWMVYTNHLRALL
jgi:cytochrome c biogenesis protein CcdA